MVALLLVVPEGEEGEEAAAEAPKEEEAKADKPESEDLGAKQLEGSTLEIFRSFIYIFYALVFIISYGKGGNYGVCQDSQS